jgi:hypothetical protein
MGKPFYIPQQQYLMMEIHYDNSNFDKGKLFAYADTFDYRLFQASLTVAIIVSI